MKYELITQVEEFPQSLRTGKRIFELPDKAQVLTIKEELSRGDYHRVPQTVITITYLMLLAEEKK